MKRKCHRSSTYPILLDWVQNLQNDELYLIKQWLKRTVPMIYNKKWVLVVESTIWSQMIWEGGSQITLLNPFLLIHPNIYLQTKIHQERLGKTVIAL